MNQLLNVTSKVVYIVIFCSKLEKLKDRKNFLEDRIAKTAIGLRLGRTQVQSQTWEEGLD